uniref:[phosphatase 2A protein]-leucine-carboxy methyltransferase n=1 Tax=Lygus hesperus TaxID=30085 RepID=A0A0A9W573_LYGHE
MTDALVQHTNDDSVLSKRSAVATGYFEDHFVRYFVKKPSRRSPLINRGYYLRMLVMNDLITSCIAFMCRVCDTNIPIQVISLGAGFDTLAARLHSCDRTGIVTDKCVDTDLHDKIQNTITEEMLRRVHFYDVDFPVVMQNKAACMAAVAVANTTNAGSVFPSTYTYHPTDSDYPIVSPHYLAVGADLR